MKIESVYSGMTNVSSRIRGKAQNANKFSELINKVNAGNDSYEKSAEELAPIYGNYSRQYHWYEGTIQSVDTGRYQIEQRERGYMRIYDRENREGINWRINENPIQVDQESGKKFLINDLGCGFFIGMVIDQELEDAIKESLGAEKLVEKNMSGFTLNTDPITGIQNLTADGYESQGGMLLLDEVARAKLDVIARGYLERCPNLVSDYNEAWFYATFEVRGMLKETPDGFMMIGPNCLSFQGKDGKSRWVSVFDPKDWEEIKKKFDSQVDVGEMEAWEFWEKFFDSKRIKVSFFSEENETDELLEQMKEKNNLKFVSIE